MAIQVISGPHIAAGESLSSVLSISAGRVLRIIMPDTWTAANLTFQISYDGTYFYDVYTEGGVEVTLPVVQNSIMGFGEFLLFAPFAKFRSGTSQNPVIQPEDRSFRVVVDTKAAMTALAENALIGDEAKSLPQPEAPAKAKAARKPKAVKVKAPKEKPTRTKLKIK